MKTGDTIIADEQSAVEYDKQAKNTNWFGPDVVFGLAFECLSPGIPARLGNRLWTERKPIL